MATSTITSVNKQIEDRVHAFKNGYLNNNATVSFSLDPVHEVWFLWRSFQPNLIKVNRTGVVEVAFGNANNVTVTASNDVVTIQNTVGWGVPYIAFISGA